MVVLHATPQNCRVRLARVAVVSLVLVMALGSAEAGRLAPDLEAVVDGAGPDDLIPIVVLMQEFPEQAQLLAEVRGLEREARRSQVVARMRSHAGTSQISVRSLLGHPPVGDSKVRVLWGINGLALVAPPGVVRRIAALPSVKSVFHDPPIALEEMLDGPTGGDESGPNPTATVAGEVVDMGAQQVWDELGVTGSGVVVAVIDSGVDRTHPDLVGQIWANPGEIEGNDVDDDNNGFVDDTWGWDFCDGDNTPTSNDPHGTQVAGQVAGDGANGTVTGMAPDAKLIALRVCQVSTWWEASDYAITNGAHIITQSVSRKWPAEPNYEAFRRQAATELAAGLIHANSTGNTGDELDTHPVPHNVSAPGDCPPPWHHADQTLLGGVTSVIGVANLDYDTDDIADSSPYGPAAWEEIRAVTAADYPYFMPSEFQDYPHDNGSAMGLLKPDLAAYGQNTLTTCPGGFYCSFGGTSAATPHVAGVLALMLSANPAATPEQLAEAILTTSELRTTSKSNRYGVGLVQAHPAVLAVMSPCNRPAAGFTISSSGARVGDPILFDSSVSGGAGGPYTYRWDFDSDGVVDSTTEDPVYAYARPYQGLVTLWVEDVDACLETVRSGSMVVTGPDLRFDGISGLVEVAGNGDGQVEPGESWDMTVALRNDGDETAAGVSAEVAVYAESPGQVSLLQQSATYPDIPPGQTITSSSAYRFQVGAAFPCGDQIPFTLTGISSTDPSNTYPDQIVPMYVALETFPDPTLLFTGFETGQEGWALNDEWETGGPQGLGGPGPDPTTAFEGDAVLGTDLVGRGLAPGNYEDDTSSPALTPFIVVPPSVTEVTMTFAQWLNVGSGDTATIQVNATGQWITVFSAAEVSADSWTKPSFDISSIVQDAANGNFRVLFRMESDGANNDSGWNIDAFEVRGTPTEGCEPVGAYPRYDQVGGLAEVAGNGDGLVDPGETWELTADLRNIGAETAMGVTAALAVAPTTPGEVSIVQGQSSFPDIDPGQVQSSSTTYRFRVGNSFPCSKEVRLTLTDIATSTPAETYPAQEGSIVIRVDGCEPFGPFPRYDSHGGLAEVEGNGDGQIDPGEIWDLIVALRNDGNGTATGVAAKLEVVPSSPDTVFVVQDSSTFPDIGPGQVGASDVAYRIRTGEDYRCGNDIPLSVTEITTADPVEVFPDQVDVVALPTAQPFNTIVYSDGMENTGWALNDEWEIGPPMGLGDPAADPASAFEGVNVLGTDLTGLGLSPGNYEDNAFELALSPFIDIPAVESNVSVSFAHWLNVAPGDTAEVLVNATGQWITILAATDVSATDWTTSTFDISEIVQGSLNSNFRVQFRIASDGQDNDSGVNIDDLVVRADDCEVFVRDSAGEVRELRVDKAGPGQLGLSWNLDCGGGTTYSVFRGDLSVGDASTVPEPGRCDVTETSILLPEGPRDGDFFLVAPNRDGLTGSYGPGPGGPRPAPATVCHPQGAIYACPVSQPSAPF